MKLVIVVAMSSELRLLVNALGEMKESRLDHLTLFSGKIGDNEVIVAQSGIGKVNAAVCATMLISEFKPDMFINSGVAGGLDASLGQLDVVVASGCHYHDVFCGEEVKYGQVQGLPFMFPCDTDCISQMVVLEPEVKVGVICSGDQFITDVAELKQIKSRFPEVLAVDMESCAIAQVCYLKEVPYISVRVISDTPGITDHAKQYANFWDLAPSRTFDVVFRLVKQLN